MQTAIVRGETKLGTWLKGARCKAPCGRVVGEGESVIYQRQDARWGDDRFVVHTACMALLVDNAPIGRPPGAPVAQVCELRRRIAATGERFPGRDVSNSRTARALAELSDA